MIKDAEYTDHVEQKKNGRRGDGGTYLAVADETEESKLAIRYAARMARAHRGNLAIVHIIPANDVQEWSNVERMMRRELREQAEKFIWSIARTVNELTDLFPGLWICEGDSHDVLPDIINQDQSIKMLVLGGGTQASGPGPLVSHFSAKGLGRLRVPVMIVPGHLEPATIDAIS